MPSCRRLACTIRLTALAIWARTALIGISIPAIAIMFSSRLIAVAGGVGVDRGHRAVVAGVHRLQHVDDLLAAGLADDDPVGPHPERVPQAVALGDGALALDVGGRLSIRPTWACCSCSSAVSSMVRIRSELSMKDDSALSVVVLPEPVPPETMTLSRVATAASR